MVDEDGKPFWMRYFKADYLGDSDPTYQKLLQKEGIGIENQEEENEEEKEEKKHLQEKLFQEWNKIKSLDKQIVGTNKVYKTMKDNASFREQEFRDRLQREKEKKKQEIEKKSKSYIKSRAKRQTNSRGSSRSKASASSKTSSKAMKNSKGFSSNPFTGMRRPSSGKNSSKSSQKQILDNKPEEEKEGTFLTGVQNPANKYAKIDSRIKDELGYDISDEDEEYDHEKHKTHEIDMINAYEEALHQSPRRRKKYFDESSSQGSGKSPSKVDFIKENTK